MTFLDENADGDNSEARQDVEQRDSVQSKKLKIKEIIIRDGHVQCEDRHINPNAEMNKTFDNTSMLIMS